jgi:Glycosyl transferase family 2
MALALVNSSYVLFLDDDDTLEPGHLQALANHITDHETDILFCDFQIRDEDRTTSPPTSLATRGVSIADVSKESVFVRNRIPNSCLVYRQAIVAQLRYETDMRIYEDWDFLLASLTQRQLTHVPINSVIIHKSSATAPENMRRGNTRDDLIVEAMLYLYKKYPAVHTATKLERQALMASAGVMVPIEAC